MELNSWNRPGLPTLPFLHLPPLPATHNEQTAPRIIAEYEGRHQVLQALGSAGPVAQQDEDVIDSRDAVPIQITFAVVVAEDGQQGQ